MTKEEAARVNCRSFNESRLLKERQLEREIRDSSASDVQKANMLHTLSKLTMFSADERDHLTRLGTRELYYLRWLGGDA